MEKINSNIDTSNKSLSKIMFWIIISIIFFNDVVRETIFGHNIFSKYNIIYIILSLMLFYKLIVYKKLKILWIVILFFFWSIGIAFNNNFDLISKLRIIFFLIIPLYFCVDNFITIKSINRFLKIYNKIIIVLLLIGIIDFFMDGKLMNYVISIFNKYPLKDLMYEERSWEVYRYYSIIGHPLTNATYFLFYLIINFSYGIKDKFVTNKVIIIIVGLLGLLISGSKTAILIGLVYITLMYGLGGKKKILNSILILSIIILLFNTSFFREILLTRFKVAINSGDITTGRNSLISILESSSYVLKPKFLGLGLGVSRKVAISLGSNIFNFEYPFIMLLYDFGYLGELIIYIYMILIPLIKGILNKNIVYIISIVAIFTMVNTNNGIANISDSTVLYGIFILMLNSIFFNKKNYEFKTEI